MLFMSHSFARGAVASLGISALGSAALQLGLIAVLADCTSTNRDLQGTGAGGAAVGSTGGSGGDRTVGDDGSGVSAQSSGGAGGDRGVGAECSADEERCTATTRRAAAAASGSGARGHRSH